MHSSAFGAAALIALRSFVRAARFSGSSARRYSSTVFALAGIHDIRELDPVSKGAFVAKRRQLDEFFDEHSAVVLNHAPRAASSPRSLSEDHRRFSAST